MTVVSQATQVSELPDRLVLPGVGAFIGGMQEMRQRGFDDLVKRFAATSGPFWVFVLVRRCCLSLVKSTVNTRGWV